MSRLIDTSELHNVVTRRKDEYGRLAVEVDNIVEEMVKETPTVRAIPIDKVRQAREEVEKLTKYGAKFKDGFEIHVNKAEVLEILDKLIESEGK